MQKIAHYCMLAALLLSGCGGGEASATKPAATRPAPTADSQPAGPRIVSTVPAATLNLLLIGATDRLVGVTKYDQLFLPESKRDLPVVGDYETMDYEQLVSLKPTALVVQFAESRIAPRLREVTAAHKIELVNMHFDHIADIWGSVRTLGRVAGHEQEAEAAITRAQTDLKLLAADFQGPHSLHPKVLYLVSPNLMLVAGSDTFIDEMITLAGGENVGAKAGKSFVDIGREAIVNLAPDVLLVGAFEEIGMQPDDPRMKPWMTLPIPAARAGRVYLVTDGNALMASVNIAENVRTLGLLIHRGETPTTTPAPLPQTQPVQQ